MKKASTNQVGMLGDFFMACSKLEAMAIYLVKQACGNDKVASVYAALPVIHTKNTYITCKRTVFLTSTLHSIGTELLLMLVDRRR